MGQYYYIRHPNYLSESGGNNLTKIGDKGKINHRKVYFYIFCS